MGRGQGLMSSGTDDFWAGTVLGPETAVFLDGQPIMEHSSARELPDSEKEVLIYAGRVRIL